MARVLVVDDHEGHLYYLLTLLRGRGYEVEGARHGAEALVRAREQLPDVLVSDLLMPVMDGYALLRQWRRDPRLSKIPFIVYTAPYTAPEDELLALRLGADAFLVKATEPEKLIGQIAECQSRKWAAQPAPSKPGVSEDPGTLMQYNDVLVRKLESKMLEVENANQALAADIAARQQAELALRQSEQDFRLLADAMPLLAWVVGPDDRGLFVNRRWLQYTGLNLDEPSQTWRTPLHPEDRGRAEDLWRTATAKVEPFSLEARLRGVDGNHRWWLISAVPVTARDGAISKWIGTCTDIEQLELAEARWRRAEAQLRQTQKMEAVGILAGGIAHDFNNLLLVIIGYSSLILDTIDPTDGFRADVEEIMRAGERAKDLVQQLLAFSRRQVHAPRVVDLKTALSNMERMLYRLLGEGIEVTLAAQPGCYIYADPNLIEQVILNLALNARDAMPAGGRVSFETLRVDIEEGAASTDSIPTPGRYCLLRVTDNGVGMDPATRERIFEPFFTTKEKGKGTGLGLATVFGIVSQSHGQISVHSAPGQGSRFDIYLPLTDRAPESSSGMEPASRALSGSETILLVEDDHQVRNLIQTLLLRQGYDVLAAANADAAIMLAEHHPSRLDLLLTDVVMPNMNGFQLGELLTARYPQLAVLYMSGYTDHPMLRRETLYEGIDFLQKPVAPEMLLRRIRDVLDQAARRRARN